MTDPEVIERARIYLVQINGGPPVNLGDALAAAEARAEALGREINVLRYGRGPDFDAQMAKEAIRDLEAETAALRAKLEAVREALTVRRSVQCRRCLGFGTVAYFGEAITCGECRGTGRIPTKAEDVVADALADAQAEVETLTTAGIAEVAARNPNVMEYMTHWEGRATKAEAETAALRAKLEAATCWQGMESAPKDGTTVFLAFQGRGISPAWWSDRGDVWTWGGVPVGEPTHWMPFPQPPAPKGEGEGE